MSNDPRQRTVDPKKCTHRHVFSTDDPICIPCHRREALFDACEDVCPHCAGHTPPYERRVDGPNDAGNYFHWSEVYRDGTLCKASSIWSRIMREEKKIQDYVTGNVV
jgi:hypothetical protein